MSRDIIIPIRSSVEERKHFKEIANRSGYSSLSEWLRNLAYSSSMESLHSDDLAQEIRSLNLQVSAIGNNLNQIAKHLNSGHEADPEPILNDVRDILKKASAVLDTARPVRYFSFKRGRKSHSDDES